MNIKTIYENARSIPTLPQDPSSIAEANASNRWLKVSLAASIIPGIGFFVAHYQEDKVKDVAEAAMGKISSDLTAHDKQAMNRKILFGSALVFQDLLIVAMSVALLATGIFTGVGGIALVSVFALKMMYDFYKVYQVVRNIKARNAKPEVNMRDIVDGSNSNPPRISRFGDPDFLYLEGEDPNQPGSQSPEH
ncbi:MAG: hypothetical protein KGJ02_03740 [Verrucomicrobiota bacterium]|nr:hypothetical protein [Verrucomicrobiota bacterium]